MPKPPSLISLGLEVLKEDLLYGDGVLPGVYDLPTHLFHMLVAILPPLALHKLQANAPDGYDYEIAEETLKNGRKRRRNGGFNSAWKAFFKLRWPDLIDRIDPVDWQQMYWETHLQNCLDEATETALLLLFDGSIGEINISGDINKFIGCERHGECPYYSKLYYHCQQFGNYLRCLRLQNVLCVAEISELLRGSKLQSLVLQLIRSKEHIDGLCKLLIHNNETLTSIEFVYCNLSSASVNAICVCLDIKDLNTHILQHFSVSKSRFLTTPLDSLPPGFVSFLSSGRCLRSLKFHGNHLEQNFGRMLLNTLMDTSSELSILDLSDNIIAGWLSNFNCRSSDNSPSNLAICKSLKSLRVLNLRENNLTKDDIETLIHVLAYMPSLEILDISDNPLEDDGIKCLLPYFKEGSESCCSISELYLENCDFSYHGATQLLDRLAALKRPLSSLSLADNSLGSQMVGALVKFLDSSIKTLNVGGIGLGSTGFQELQKGLTSELQLVKINISKNRGGSETAKFLSKLMPLAPKLVAIDATFNLMPEESLTVICSALKVAKGKLEQLDLNGNLWEYQPTHASILNEFQFNGRPILIFPSSVILDVPYDDEP